MTSRSEDALKRSRRRELTATELERLPARELIDLAAGGKLTDSERANLRLMNARRAEERKQRVERISIEVRPVINDLRSVGVSVTSISDLICTSVPYPSAVPVLLHHLTQPYSDAVKEGIARALAVPHPLVQDAWPLLIDEYRRAPSGLGFLTNGDSRQLPLRAKDGLACALAAAVTEKTLGDLIALAKDPTHGPSRLLLLSPLKRRRNRDPMVRRAVEELRKDPELIKEIDSWSARAR